MLLKGYIAKCVLFWSDFVRSIVGFGLIWSVDWMWLCLFWERLLIVDSTRCCVTKLSYSHWLAGQMGAAIFDREQPHCSASALIGGVLFAADWNTNTCLHRHAISVIDCQQWMFCIVLIRLCDVCQIVLKGSSTGNGRCFFYYLSVEQHYQCWHCSEIKAITFYFRLHYCSIMSTIR